jgi:SAM-dependent methyltransferase
MDRYNEMVKSRKRYTGLVRKTPLGHREMLQLYLESRPAQTKVLDFGCGGGSFAVPLSIEYYGYDTDAANPRASFRSLQQMSSVHFDTIVISHVIEHMHRPELEKTLRWCGKHGDELIITTPNLNYAAAGNFWNDIGHTQPYGSLDLPYLVEQAGFTVKRVYYHGLFGRKNVPRLAFHRALCWIAGNSPYMEFTVFARKQA